MTQMSVYHSFREGGSVGLVPNPVSMRIGDVWLSSCVVEYWRVCRAVRLGPRCHRERLNQGTTSHNIDVCLRETSS